MRVMITLDGRCLRLVALPTGERHLRADENPPCDDSVFERIDLAHGRVALRAADGRYLARHVTHPDEAEAEGTGERTGQEASLHLVTELTQCAAFEELPVPGGAVALRSCDLRYLGIDTSGAVVADRVADGSWERFHYVEVPSLPAPPPLPAVAAQPGSTVESVKLAAV